jgi:hypothetical protein
MLQEEPKAPKPIADINRSSYDSYIKCTTEEYKAYPCLHVGFPGGDVDGRLAVHAVLLAGRLLGRHVTDRLRRRGTSNTHNRSLDQLFNPLRACQRLGKVRPNFPGTFICFGSRIGPKTLVRTSVADLDPLFGLLDPDPLVRDKDSDPSIIKQK